MTYEDRRRLLEVVESGRQEGRQAHEVDEVLAAVARSLGIALDVETVQEIVAAVYGEGHYA